MLLFTDDENYSVIALVLDEHCQRLRSVHISPVVREQLNGSILNMNADTDNRQASHMLSVDVRLRSASQKPHTRYEITNGATITQVSAVSFDLVKTVRITGAHEKVQTLSDSIRQFLLHKGAKFTCFNFNYVIFRSKYKTYLEGRYNIYLE